MFSPKPRYTQQSTTNLPPLGAFRSRLLPFNSLATCLAVGVALASLADPLAILIRGGDCEAKFLPVN